MLGCLLRYWIISSPSRSNPDPPTTSTTRLRKRNISHCRNTRSDEISSSSSWTRDKCGSRAVPCYSAYCNRTLVPGHVTSSSILVLLIRDVCHMSTQTWNIIYTYHVSLSHYEIVNDSTLMWPFYSATHIEEHFLFDIVLANQSIF